MYLRKLIYHPKNQKLLTKNFKPTFMPNILPLGHPPHIVFAKTPLTSHFEPASGRQSNLIRFHPHLYLPTLSLLPTSLSKKGDGFLFYRFLGSQTENRPCDILICINNSLNPKPIILCRNCISSNLMRGKFCLKRTCYWIYIPYSATCSTSINSHPLFKLSNIHSN